MIRAVTPDMKLCEAKDFEELVEKCSLKVWYFFDNLETAEKFGRYLFDNYRIVRLYDVFKLDPILDRDWLWALEKHGFKEFKYAVFVYYDRG